MASGTGEWSGNWMKASNSGAYRFVKVDSTSFNESTGVTTVNWHVGTYVSYGNFYGSVVSSWGSCTHSYSLNGAGGYDYHYATSNVAYNGNIHFVEGCGYTSSSAGGWIQSALDVYWYPTLPTYAVSYNANGGSGAPAAQTKTWGTNLTLSSTVPTRTGYTFGGWNTKSDGTGTTYAKGGTYSANAKVTLYAKWTIITYPISYANGGHGTAPAAQTKTYGTALTLRPGMGTVSNYKFKDWKATNGTTYNGGGSYTANATTTMTAEWYAPYSVTYDANGGTGAPSSQVKVYGDSVNISSTVPTRTNYNFIEWNTNSSGTGTKYTAGQAYSTNANLALYAIWEIAHSNPTISNLLVQRCLQDGTLADDGEYCKVSATVSVDNSTEGYTDTKLKTVTVQVGSNDAESVTVDTTATSASISFISANQLLLTSTYAVKLTVTDSHDFSSYRTSNLSIAYFTMHFKEGGHGIAIGKKSVTDNLFDVNMNTSINGNLDASGSLDIGGNLDASGSLTIGGNSTVNGSLAKFKGQVINYVNGQRGTTPSANTYRTYEFNDTEGRRLSQVESGLLTDGKNALNLYVLGHYTSANDYAGIQIYKTNGNTGNYSAQYNANTGRFYTKTIETPDRAVSYIDGAKGDAALYARKAYNQDHWYPAVCLETKGGGSWSMGNYNNEYLQFSYATKANRDSGTNSTTIVNLRNTAGTIALVPTQLYYNATGTNGTVGLSASAASYNHMRIYFKKNGDTNACASTDLHSPNGKKATLIIGNVSSSTAQLAWKVVTVSGTSITVSSQIYWNRDMSSGSMTGSMSDSNIYIYRVVAWNE